MKKKGMKQSAKMSIDLITTIIVTLIAGAVTVAAVISMAWFASNKEVGTNGSSVTVDAEMFEVGYKTVTNQISGTNSLTNLLNTFQYVLNGSGDTDHPSLYVTASDNVKIACKINIQSTDENDVAEDSIRPGSYGYFSFFIIPKKDGLVFKINSELIGISTAYGNYVDSDFSIIPNTQDGDSNEVISSKTLAANTETDRLQTALRLLKGHIMLFSDENYSDLLNDNVYIDYAINADTEYEGRIYWKWIRTYSELSEYVPNPETDSNRDMYLLDGNGKIGYNNGDQAIGDAFDHILIQLLVNTINDEDIPLDGMKLTQPTD